MKSKIFSFAVLLFAGTHLFAASAEDYLQAARKYLSDGEVNAAVIELKNALQEDPANLEARLMLGGVYLKLRDGSSAEKELKRAIALQAAKEHWQLQLGRAYLLQRKYR